MKTVLKAFFVTPGDEDRGRPEPRQFEDAAPGRTACAHRRLTLLYPWAVPLGLLARPGPRAGQRAAPKSVPDRHNGEGELPCCAPASRIPKKNLAGTKGPAKFEQGGFTSTRRRVRRPLSGRKSRKLVWSRSAPKTRSDQVSRDRNIQLRTSDHNRELVLAHLQKPQCYEQGVKLGVGRKRRTFTRAGFRPPCAAGNRGKR
jgi:hypothetical protein